MALRGAARRAWPLKGVAKGAVLRPETLRGASARDLVPFVDTSPASRRPSWPDLADATTLSIETDAMAAWIASLVTKTWALSSTLGA